MSSQLTTVLSSRRVLYMGFKTLAVTALLATAAFAQNIAGTWQGTLQTPQRTLRLVMKVTRADDESIKAMFYSIDQNGPGIAGSAASLQGTTFKATIPAIGGSYEGKLSADGTTINGTFTQGAPLPLNLVKATPSTEWAIPEPPPPPRVMAADAKPVFEVATIKPSNPNSPRAGNQRRTRRWKCLQHAEYAAFRADQIRLRHSWQAGGRRARRGSSRTGSTFLRSPTRPGSRT